MPCEDCGHLLCVDKNQATLYCPRCQNLPIESQAVIEVKTEYLLEEHFTDENIIAAVEKYSKTNLILYLLTRLNLLAKEFYDENGMPIGDFGYFSYIIKQVYKKAEFGDEQLENPLELDDDIALIRDAYITVLQALRDAQNQFVVCIEQSEFSGEFLDFTSDYKLPRSEYGLCFERCVESIICGDPEKYEDYTYVVDELRSVEKTDHTEISNSTEFADAWFQFLLQLRFIASTDDMVGEIYYTLLPDDINVFHLEVFLDTLDSQLSSQTHQAMEKTGYITTLSPSQVDKCGRYAFGKKWDVVREHVIVSETNLDAHPFLFELEVEQKFDRPGFWPDSIFTTQVFYPRFLSRLLKFQIFPLLKNGSGLSGHELLKQQTERRGEALERNLYQYLTDQGFECYHSAEISRNNRNEIDLLCIIDDSIVFIELKFYMPPIRINSYEGIRILDEKFDLDIFNEVSEDSQRTPSGKPFNEKIQSWLELNPGQSFSSQTGPSSSDREKHAIPQDWSGLDVEKYVVSNIVPSYIQKNGIQFLTDLEFYRMIEHGEDVPYVMSSVVQNDRGKK